MKREPVVLVLPNSRWFDKRVWLMLPHAALLLTALLKDEFDFSIIDANQPVESQQSLVRMLVADRIPLTDYAAPPR